MDWLANPYTDADGFVYFIREQHGIHIKIGWAIKPLLRIRELQVGNPRRLVFIGAIPGAPCMERQIHSYFHDLRRSGEWFEETEDLLVFIKQWCDPDLFDEAAKHWLATRTRSMVGA